MNIVWKTFLGALPQFDPASMPPNTGVDAFNVRLERGSLQAFRKPLPYKHSTKSKIQNTVYRFAPDPGQPDSGYLFSWEEVVHVVPGPVAGNSQHLTYWTGQDYPRFTDASIATKAGPLPSNSYKLGVPAPEFGPHVELTDRPPPDERDWNPEIWYASPPLWWPRLEPHFWPEEGDDGYLKYRNSADWPEKKPDDWPSTEPAWWPKEYPPVQPEWWPKSNAEYPKKAPEGWPDTDTPPDYWPKKWRWIWPNPNNAEANSPPVFPVPLPDLQHWPYEKPDWWPPAWQLVYYEEPAGARDEVDRDYVLTFTQQLGSLVMEGPPSTPSKMITVTPAVAVRVSNIATVPSGDYPWHSKRLYRRIYSGGIVQYALVSELALDAEAYVDKYYDSELKGDLLTSQNALPPPDDLHSLNVLTNGILFGARDNDCCLSDPYLPHAWNPFARYPFPHTIVGVGTADNNIVVITEKNPYLLTGVQATAMTSVELHLEQGCVSPRSIVSGAFGCAYASPDGIVNISTSGSGLITEGIFTRDQWQSYNPRSMIFAVNENLLIGCYTRKDGSKGAMILDPRLKNAGVRFTDQTFTAAYRDGLLDSLIVYDPKVPGQFCLWDQGTALPYRWRSDLKLLASPVNMTAVRVEADSYTDLTFRLIIGDTVKHETKIPSRYPVRLPSGYSDRRVQIEIEGLDTVRKISLAESPSELE